MRLHRAAGVLAGTLAAAALAGWPSAPAHAHASAIASWPAIGQTLTASPGRVTIEFDTEISPAVLLAVVDAEGASLTDGDPVVDGVYVTQALKPSGAPGAWNASFHVISADQHPIIGRVDFVVDPDGVATANPAGDPPDLGLDDHEEPARPASDAAGGGGAGPLLLLGGVGGVVLLIVLLRVVAARRTAS